jgi:two-component system chemotaxis response regulator CheB
MVEGRAGVLPAAFARDGDKIEVGHIYVAPPDHHMVLGFDSIRLNQGPKVHYTRPAADPLFISAAEAHGKRVMGVVLSGGNSDGAAGLRAIAEHGGTALETPAKNSSPRVTASSGMPSASCTRVTWRSAPPVALRGRAYGSCP